MSFDIRPELLGESYRDPELGFSFSLPKGTHAVPDSVQDLVQQNLTDMLFSDTLLVLPKKFFLNHEQNVLCIVSHLPQVSAEPENIAAYCAAIEDKLAGSDFQHGNYRYRDFHVFQFRAIFKEFVLFKLFLPQQNEKSFQLDYILPKQYYNETIKAVESSIGSLTKI